MKESIVFSRIVMLCCLAFVTALSAMASSPNNDVWQSHAQDVNQAMENFIEAASREDPFRQRIPLTYSDFIDKQDKPVRIINGPFAGVEGEIKRIGHRRIVVSLLRDTHSALGLCNVAPSDLEFI